MSTKARTKTTANASDENQQTASWTVTELVAAVSQLRPSEFLRLREKLDEIEEQQWRDSLAKITKRTRAKGVTDEQIDEMVMRRRRESSR